jgi:DUF1365 family protein
MEQRYAWRLAEPGDTVTVEMRNEEAGREAFRARLALTRRPLTRLGLFKRLVALPFMSLRVVAAIYFEALRLWLKRASFHPHPKKRPPVAARSES